MKQVKELPHFSISREASDDEIILAWEKYAREKYRSDDFQGQLSLLKTPKIVHGTYQLAYRKTNAKFFINTNVANDWYGEPSKFYSEFQTFSRICPKCFVEKDIIFDCGAHHGLYSILFSAECGDDGKVFSFELVPLNADLSRFNADINGVKNIEVFPIGLSSKDETIRASQQDHSMITAQKGRVDIVEMELRRLDNFGYLNPTFIKLDVEGAEVDVLIGATMLLKKRIRWVVSVHPPFLLNFGHNPKEIFTYLPFSEYVCYIVYPGRNASEYKGEFEITTFCELAFFPK